MDQVSVLLKGIPQERRQLLQALHLVQDELGWLPREALRQVAKHLRLAEAEVYGPASYYSEFRLTPPPRMLVTWCSGPACRVLGGDRIRVILEAELGCQLGENAPDDAFGLWLGQCNGTCEQAPQLWVNGRVLGGLTLAETVRLARRIKDGEDVAPVPDGMVVIQPVAQPRAPEGAV